MAYREVHMFDVKEVVRRWLRGEGNKPIARQLGMDPETVRGYVKAAERCGLVGGGGEETLTDDAVAAVLESVRPVSGRPKGEGWSECEREREFIADLLQDEVHLTKIRKLLLRKRQARVSYATLRRFAIGELGFAAPETSIPVMDGVPGDELQVDTGWMTYLKPDAERHRRRFRAWIFTAVFSRHRFVYPVLRETTETAIEACEAAWQYYVGIQNVRPGPIRNL